MSHKPTKRRGFEIDGIAVWFHPLRLDTLPGLQSRQEASLKEDIRMREADEGRGTSDKRIAELYLDTLDAEMSDEESRQVEDIKDVSFLVRIREHHIENGGAIYNMAAIGHHLKATWCDGINLANVVLPHSSIYVHTGETLEHDDENAEQLIEGFYVSRVDEHGQEGWLATFVTDYPDWDEAERHTPAQTEAEFARYFSILIPDGYDIWQGDFEGFPVHGNEKLAAASSYRELTRMVASAMLYLSQSNPDLQNSMVMLRTALRDTFKPYIVNCEYGDSDPRIDWAAARFRPGRWKVEEEGGNGRPLVVNWVRPRPLSDGELEEISRDGGRVVSFAPKAAPPILH